MAGGMFDELLGALERHHEIHDWTASRRRRRSVQLYLLGNEIESLREVSVEEYDVEVYNDHQGHDERGMVRGTASVKLVPGDRARLQQRLDDAVTMARLVHNPPYPLPEPASHPEVPLADPALASGEAAIRAADSFADQLWGLVAKEEGVRLSAAELFLTYSEVQLRNSRGIDVAGDGTDVLAELVLLAGGAGAEEAEHFRQMESRRVEDLHLAQQVAESATFARDTLRAQAPKTRVGPVIIGNDALPPLFEPLLFQASAAAAYAKLARTQIGESVLGDRSLAGDRLTLRSDALRPFGRRSHRFDADGVPGHNALLIEAGVLRARTATQRYGHYLQLPVTGAPGNTVVEASGAALDTLLASAEGPVYHVLRFSAPDVDRVTGDFGSEIRLGYEITPSGRRPIKGGSVGGNVFDAFANVRFSQERAERGDYYGPEAAYFASLRVSGDE